jgi:effector-binding domain-containing protein
VYEEVRVVPTVASPTAVVRRTTTWSEYPSLWRTLLDEVWAFLRAGDCPVRPDGHNVMLYLDDVPNVEVGVQVSGPFPPVSETGVVPSVLPAGQAAMTVLHGSYDGLDGAHRAVLQWCSTSGHALTGTRWEIYGDWDDDPAKVETAVYYLLR